MKARPVALYASIAFNAALLVLVAWPRHDSNVAFGQYGLAGGSFAAVSAKGGGSQDATWIADRVSGALLVYQYSLGAQADPIALVGSRDLRVDLEEKQIGNIMLIPASISDSRGLVYCLDMDSQHMVAYEFNRSTTTVTGVQKIDLRADINTATHGGATEDFNAAAPGGVMQTPAPAAGAGAGVDVNVPAEGGAAVDQNAPAEGGAAGDENAPAEGVAPEDVVPGY
jgi:hypothetical protein